MRVGFDARWLQVPQLVAYNRYIVNLLRGLTRERGVEVYLFTSDKRPIYDEHLKSLHLTVVALPGWRELLWEQVHVPLALRRHRIDIYHAPADGGLPAAKVCRYVLTSHSVPHRLYFRLMLNTGELPGTLDDYLGDLKPSHPVVRGLYLRMRGTVLRWHSFQRADRIITLSETTKRELITLLHLPVGKLRVVRPAPDPVFQQPVSKDAIIELRKKYSLPDRYVLSVATVARLKNTAGLLRAFAMAKRTVADAGLVLCSHVGYEVDRYRALARELGLREGRDLFFLEKTMDEELRCLYRGATAFALLSWYESFSFPTVEAMASGTATIASKFACLPETVSDGGILVDPRELDEVALTIRRVLQDDQLRRDLQERALRRARDFSWEETVQQTLQVYREVEEGKGS
jgi:glycosyltransferase involved in cell wall biosynthesis